MALELKSSGAVVLSSAEKPFVKILRLVVKIFFVQKTRHLADVVGLKNPFHSFSWKFIDPSDPF